MRAAHRGGLFGGLDAGEAGQGAPGGAGQDRGRGALHRRRGRRPLPRRPRRAGAGWTAGELPRAGRGRPRFGGQALCRHPRPVPHQAARRPLRGRSEPGPEGAGAVRRHGPGRAPPRRHIARVVRGRRTAATAPRQPRAAAPGGRGDRPARAGPLLAELAERRRPRPLRRRRGSPARGPDLAPGRGADAEDLGTRRAASASRLIQPELAGRALHQRRAGLDRGRGAWAERREGRSLLPRGRPAGGPAAGEHQDRCVGGRGPRRHPRAALPLRAPRLRAAQRSDPGGRRFARRRAAAAGTVIGRWSLSAPLFEGAPSSGPRTRALAELMLERHGIVTRETAIAEGIPGGFASIYGELQNLELLGTARRGYFVEGLGGAQFALPGAVERLRSLPGAEGSLQVLAATDPANPYGATLSWPKLEGQRRPARTAGAYVMLRDGEPLLYVERGGKGILRLQELDEDELAGALAELASAAQRGVIERLAIERLDGEPVIGSGMEGALIEAGFRRQPRRLVA